MRRVLFPLVLPPQSTWGLALQWPLLALFPTGLRLFLFLLLFAGGLLSLTPQWLALLLMLLLFFAATDAAAADGVVAAGVVDIAVAAAVWTVPNGALQTSLTQQ